MINQLTTKFDLKYAIALEIQNTKYMFVSLLSFKFAT